MFSKAILLNGSKPFTGYSQFTMTTANGSEGFYICLVSPEENIGSYQHLNGTPLYLTQDQIPEDSDLNGVSKLMYCYGLTEDAKQFFGASDFISFPLAIEKGSCGIAEVVMKIKFPMVGTHSIPMYGVYGPPLGLMVPNAEMWVMTENYTEAQILAQDLALSVDNAGHIVYETDPPTVGMGYTAYFIASNPELGALGADVTFEIYDKGYSEWTPSSIGNHHMSFKAATAATDAALFTKYGDITHPSSSCMVDINGTITNQHFGKLTFAANDVVNITMNNVMSFPLLTNAVNVVSDWLEPLPWLSGPGGQGVTNISFANCNNLKNVPANFFENQNKLTSLYYTFNNCSKLVNAPDIPNSVTNMRYTFYNCRNLVNAPVIPNSVTDMYSTFSNCYNLINAPEIPNSVTNMYSTFSNCYNLINAPAIPSSVTNMCSTFRGCSNLVNAPVIPNSVTDISSMFSGCVSITDAPIIPNSVTTVYSAFSNCTSLRSLPAIPNHITSWAYVYANCSQFTEAPTIPNSITDISGTFQGWNKMTVAPTIPNSVTTVAWTFSNCTSLINAPVIPNSVTSMYCTFTNCTSLTSAPTIPDSVTNVAWAFSNCKLITSAPTIPANVTNMYYAFSYCKNLSGNVDILANNVTNAVSCFAQCSNCAKTIRVYPNTNTYNAFYKAMGNATYNSSWNATLSIFGCVVTFTYTDTDAYVHDGTRITNIVDVPWNSSAQYTIYKYGYAPITQTVTVGDEQAKTVDLGSVISSMTPSPYTVTFNVDQTDAVITTSFDNITRNDKTIKAYAGMDVTYSIKKKGYKAVTGTLSNITSNQTIDVTMEESYTVDIDLSYPFNDEYNQLTNLVDGNNFVIDASTSSIMSGPSSYNVNSGTSYGYIKVTTEDTCTLQVTCYTSSESNYDWGGVYIGSVQYKPTQSQIKNGTTDGNGSYLCKMSGSGSATAYSAELAANTTYYVSFFYAKDSSVNNNNDRFYITNIKYTTKEV